MVTEIIVTNDQLIDALILLASVDENDSSKTTDDLISTLQNLLKEHDLPYAHKLGVGYTIKIT